MRRTIGTSSRGNMRHGLISLLTVVVVLSLATAAVLTVSTSRAMAALAQRQANMTQEGYDADLVLVNPDERWTVDSAQFVSKGKATPFNGKKVRGKVHVTFIGGKTVYIAP